MIQHTIDMYCGCTRGTRPGYIFLRNSKALRLSDRQTYPHPHTHR